MKISKLKNYDNMKFCSNWESLIDNTSNDKVNIINFVYKKNKSYN